VSEGLYVGASVETRVLNVTTAIAYWVAKNRRGEGWADLKQSNGENEVRRLVKHYCRCSKTGWATVRSLASVSGGTTTS
jgi:hypothetical protein